MGNKEGQAVNIVVLIGRLTRDPEFRYTPSSGTPVTTFLVQEGGENWKSNKC